MKPITIEEISLEVLRYYSQHRVDVFSTTAPGLNKKNFRLHIFPQLEEHDEMGIRHIFRLVGTDILKQTYPSDWWQAFKERWMPKWVLRLSPVKYSEIVARHMFPFLQEELGEEVVKVFVRSKDTN